MYQNLTQKANMQLCNVLYSLKTTCRCWFWMKTGGFVGDRRLQRHKSVLLSSYTLISIHIYTHRLISKLTSQPFSFLFQRYFTLRAPSMPLSLRRVCVRAAFQPAPGCQLIVDNYSYLTAAFTASPFWRHLQRENMPSRGP